MKRGLKYKITAPIFGGIFTALVVGAITSASSMIISGLAALLVIGFITNLIIAKIVKPLADSAAKMNQSLGEISTAPTSLTTLESLIHEMKANSEKEIENSGKETDNIMNIINDLRFRAHLLALNAAVESARAGKAGRGFTLIAAEIKNLAQRTTEASKTLQALVTQNMASAKKALQLVNESSGFFSTVMKTIDELG